MSAESETAWSTPNWLQMSWLPPSTTEVYLRIHLDGPCSAAFVSVTTYDDEHATQSVMTLAVDCRIDEAYDRAIGLLRPELERAINALGCF